MLRLFSANSYGCRAETMEQQILSLQLIATQHNYICTLHQYTLNDYIASTTEFHHKFTIQTYTHSTTHQNDKQTQKERGSCLLYI